MRSARAPWPMTPCKGESEHDRTVQSDAPRTASELWASTRDTLGTPEPPMTLEDAVDLIRRVLNPWLATKVDRPRKQIGG